MELIKLCDSYSGVRSSFAPVRPDISDGYKYFLVSLEGGFLLKGWSNTKSTTPTAIKRILQKQATFLVLDEIEVKVDTYLIELTITAKGASQKVWEEYDDRNKDNFESVLYMLGDFIEVFGGKELTPFFRKGQTHYKDGVITSEFTIRDDLQQHVFNLPSSYEKYDPTVYFNSLSKYY